MNPILVYRADEDISEVSTRMISFNMREAELFTFEFPFLRFFNWGTPVMEIYRSPASDVQVSKVKETFPGRSCIFRISQTN